MTLISHNDSRLAWLGAITVETTEDFSRAWRIPFHKKGLFEETLVLRAGMPAGVRLAFQSNTRALAVNLVPLEGNTKLDLMVDGRVLDTATLDGRDRVEWNDLPEGEKRIELWLPQRGQFDLRSLEIDDGATFATVTDERLRWITYGSSITHCGEAASPSQTWPAIVAQAYDLYHFNLGYGGQCHLDPGIARMIRDLPADFISICAGINIQGSGSLNARTFPSNLIGFVEILREKHPTTPLVIISPIYSFKRETEPNVIGWNLCNYRKSVKESVERLRAHGDHAIHYIDGLELYDESLGHLMPDNLHPNADGYRALGKRFIEQVGPVLFEPHGVPAVEEANLRRVANIA
ncbi:MAG TPA: SGNH/GDSL hydrolase family protein [Chthoniobacteraceae bacterium]|nr:SGNH/GDSL hydrolase family protein [Chthoniobacteraceae bacterium]